MRLTFFHLLPALPICVPIWMKPPLLVNIAGILSPIPQQLLFVLVNRKSSPHFPSRRFRPSNELINKFIATLKAGPHVGRVATRLLWMVGDPTEIIPNSKSDVS